MSNLIAITIGDINGVGIEIVIKSWKKKKIKNFILFSNYSEIVKYIKKKKINIKLNILNDDKKKLNFQKDKFNIYDYECNSSEENSFKSLKYAYKFCKKNICYGMITLPLRKDLIKKISNRFIGHTEFFQKIDNKKYSNMILFHKKIIVSPLTTHIKIKNISKLITNKEFLYNQIMNLYKTMKIDFNFVTPRLVISGFNPHSGENGNIGNEENNSIIPVLKKLRKKGVNIDGPISADSMLITKKIKKYDCYIFIFHDQALIPFKFISKFSGVNYTGNLNIIRTSPDHGTAYDMVGSKYLSNISFLNCFELIKKISINRKKNGKS